MKQRVHVVIMWNWPYVGAGIPWAAAELAAGFRATRFDPTFYIPFTGPGLPRGLRIQSGASRKLMRIFNEERVRRFAIARLERKVLRAVRRDGPGALVWLWPGATVGFLKKLREAGAIIIREMINTHRATARRIIEAEEARSGLEYGYTVTDDELREEAAMLAEVDLFVSPSISVDQSLIEAGIAEDRIIKTMFGWDPRALSHRGSTLPGSGVKAIFIGTLYLRKGIHLALSAWRKAAIDGTFIIVGDLMPPMKLTVERYLGEDVIHIPYTDDLAAIYHGADFMFFPTLEEGAPLVVYQAAGCGLPVITTEMGTARIIEDGKSGIVVDSHDEDQMVAALRKLASDPDLRAAMGQAAKQAADRATWVHAAQERADLVVQRLGLQ